MFNRRVRVEIEKQRGWRIVKMDVVYLAPGPLLIKRKLYIREALHVEN